jgi:hypothetical protein
MQREAAKETDVELVVAGTVRCRAGAVRAVFLKTKLGVANALTHRWNWFGNDCVVLLPVVLLKFAAVTPSPHLPMRAGPAKEGL